MKFTRENRVASFGDLVKAMEAARKRKGLSLSATGKFHGGRGSSQTLLAAVRGHTSDMRLTTILALLEGLGLELYVVAKSRHDQRLESIREKSQAQKGEEEAEI